jgi:ABC-type transport system involved in multi-copper enzyme maturation permease subunit
MNAEPLARIERLAPVERRAPPAAHVIRSIAERELRLALRRKLVRNLFRLSLLPPLFVAAYFIVQVTVKELGTELKWDPLLVFMQAEAFFVMLLALGLGTPLIANDRSEEVLFLYATRPVLPWHYALGKQFAVAVPAAALLAFPAVFLVVLRQGILTDVSLGDSLGIVLKSVLAAAVLGWGYGGATVGASAMTRRARWALFLALGVFLIPEAISDMIHGEEGPGYGPVGAADDLFKALLGDLDAVRGAGAAAILAAYGTVGYFFTIRRVRQEMIP